MSVVPRKLPSDRAAAISGAGLDRATRAMVAHGIASVVKRHNPRFNCDLFYIECGLNQLAED